MDKNKSLNMKKIILMLIASSQLISFGISAQSKTNSSTGIRFPYNITPYAIINNATGDTLQWFLNRDEINSAISASASSTSSTAQSNLISRVPMSIYTFSITPLYHISAPVYSICVTKDTGLYIKVLGTDSANWYKFR